MRKFRDITIGDLHYNNILQFVIDEIQNDLDELVTHEIYGTFEKDDKYVWVIDLYNIFGKFAKITVEMVKNYKNLNDNEVVCTYHVEFLD